MNDLILGLERNLSNFMNHRINFIYLSLLLLSISAFIHGIRFFEFLDESCNMVEGWWISQGLLPYRDFFSQHVPFPSIYVYFLTLFGAQSHWQFRLGYIVTITFFFIFFSAYLKNKFNLGILAGIIIFVIYSVTYPLYFGNMIMAENFVGLTSLLIAGICYKNNNFRFTFYEQLVLSLSIFIMGISSLVSVYPLTIFGIYLFSGFIKNGFILSLKYNKYLFIFTPICFIIFIFCAYNLGILYDFLDQSIFFNLEYYSKYTGDYTSIDIIYVTLSDFLKFIIYNVDSIQFHPGRRMLFDRLITFGIVASFIILLKSKNYIYSSFLLFFTIFQKIRPVWLHEESYYILSFFSLLIALDYLYTLSKKLGSKKKILNDHSRSFGLIGLALISGIILITAIFCVQIINMYTIGDDPYSHYIQKYSNSSDRLFTTPYFPINYLDTHRLPASRYYVYTPWMADSAKISQKLINDLEDKPKIMIVDMSANIWGYRFSDFARNLIDKVINKEYKEYVVYDGHPSVRLYIQNDYIYDILKTYPHDILGEIGAYQEANEAPVGEIIGNVTIGQTFVSPHPNLNAIEVDLATYARENNKEVEFHLRKSPFSLTDLVTLKVNAKEIPDNKYYLFRFPRINDSQNKSYYFFIESPSSLHGNAITIWSSREDKYKEGSAYLNHMRIQGDLTFRTYSQKV